MYPHFIVNYRLFSYTCDMICCIERVAMYEMLKGVITELVFDSMLLVACDTVVGEYYRVTPPLPAFVLEKPVASPAF